MIVGWSTRNRPLAGLSTLNEGQQIEYEIEENRGKTSAVNLRSSDLVSGDRCGDAVGFSLSSGDATGADKPKRG